MVGLLGRVTGTVLLNGADGMADMSAKALTMGGTGPGPARQLLPSMNQNGQAPNGASPLDGACPLDGVASPRAVRKVPVDEK
ncbi:hypothetical protein STVIR_0662 [Streptomyces viridochromogenes Tue57]|uniref:Uncharacterized protein n=1 Tax=Streptomyces viridochromogenes Tue57 TaxID=1160705 RepID=L8PLE4_STRVR|nr:hypothetical protein STVIR_0662 [Streptomyces viridochromogenes Tue57]